MPVVSCYCEKCGDSFFLKDELYIPLKASRFKITKDLEIPIKGKHVYLVDDIFDSGNTMKALIEFIKIKNPKSINVVTLAKRKKTEPLENMVWGFEVDEEWLCGMGMDNENGHLRNHPVLYAL